ncbi:hypothetical protein A5892_04580 [Halotalea alkalilenta]|uniref:Uncharacterized protein n=2 Tax=Halotalea alkalilenta TaxID=376489 RepID=A0A172YC49_9GAMM|nr:hypothetical protein A5892_04580 [Halotalea alkalilenta]
MLDEATMKKATEYLADRILNLAYTAYPDEASMDILSQFYDKALVVKSALYLEEKRLIFATYRRRIGNNHDSCYGARLTTMGYQHLSQFTLQPPSSVPAGAADLVFTQSLSKFELSPLIHPRGKTLEI